MIEKNQEFEVVIEGYGSEGQGVARKDGFVIFVPYSIINEVVKVHIIKTTKTYAVGKIVEIIKQSENRVCPKCSVYKKCGGCTLQHLTYNHSLEIKKQIVSDALEKIGGFKNLSINNVEASNISYEYRNKASFPLVLDQQGQLQLCMYRGLSHDPIYINDCDITSQKINNIAHVFKESANKYIKKEQLSLFRHLVIREIEGKLLVTVVSMANVQNLTNLYSNIRRVLELDDSSFGLYLCKKNKDNNVILEGELVHVGGLRNIIADILGVKVEVSPLSFFQVNQDIMLRLYKKVVDNVDNSEVVIDAYSGAGLMSALISKKAKQVYGLEIVKEATENANALTLSNKITNLANINGDVANLLPSLTTEMGNNYTLVLDPPRKGVDKKVIDTILMTKPKKILYVSCGPASLARDLKLICEGGYKIQEVSPYDMFPQTAHVETFVSLTKI